MFQEFEQIIDDDGRSASDIATPSTDRESNKSLGIGLAVVARYVRNMNGQIRVRSEIGKGTIFGIELPFEHATAVSEGSQSYYFSKGGARLPSVISTSSGSAPSMTIRLPTNRGDKEETVLTVPVGHEIDSRVEQSPQKADSPGPSSGRSTTTPGTGSSTSAFPFPQVDAESKDRVREFLSVLIAEDNPINARLLSRRLQKLGHRVEVASDGQQCHDHFASNPHKVDVIFMDLQA